jgi:hypothetical protein
VDEIRASWATVFLRKSGNSTQNYSSFYVKLLYNENSHFFTILSDVFFHLEGGWKPVLGIGLGVATISEG